MSEEPAAPLARRADDLPADAPWWARWIESNWPVWSLRIKRTGAALVVIAPQLYEYIPELKGSMSDAMFHNMTSALGFLVLFGTLEKKVNQGKG